jgi:hypothetical protein
MNIRFHCCNEEFSATRHCAAALRNDSRENHLPVMDGWMWGVGLWNGIIRSVLWSLDLQNQPPRRHYNRAVLTSCGNADILLLENSPPPHAKPSVLSSDGKKRRRCAKSVTKCQEWREMLRGLTSSAQKMGTKPPEGGSKVSYSYVGALGLQAA